MFKCKFKYTLARWWGENGCGHVRFLYSDSFWPFKGCCGW